MTRVVMDWHCTTDFFLGGRECFRIVFLRKPITCLGTCHSVLLLFEFAGLVSLCSHARCWRSQEASTQSGRLMDGRTLVLTVRKLSSSQRLALHVVVTDLITVTNRVSLYRSTAATVHALVAALFIDGLFGSRDMFAAGSVTATGLFSSFEGTTKSPKVAQVS